MRTYEKNEIQTYSKVNHVHYCAVYLDTKDVVNFIRHYIFIRMSFKGEFRCKESLRAEVTSLTGWNAKVITNAIARLKKDGEIEQTKDGIYRPNPKVGNRFNAFYSKKYGGKEPTYKPHQEKLIEALKKLIHTRMLPSNQRKADELQAVQEEEAENMVALMKIERLEQTVEKQNELLMSMQELLKELMSKVDPDTQVKVKRHLELVVTE